jgi:hypothetical protein
MTMTKNTRERDQQNQGDSSQDASLEENRGAKKAVRDHENKYHDGDDGPLHGGDLEAE